MINICRVPCTANNLLTHQVYDLSCHRILGMMLDMSLMRGVWVDSQGKVAYAQAGCLLGDVDRESQVAGLAAVLGFNSATGIAGLTLGGGFGYLTRRWGWTSDNVSGMNIVTAEGKYEFDFSLPGN